MDDLIALLDHLGRKKIIKVGLSMGGFIAHELAFRHPERVSALVVIGATPLTMRYPAWEKIALRWSRPCSRFFPGVRPSA